jgi:type I restriction enzyme R subunit
MNSRLRIFKALQDGKETASVLDELHKSFAALTQEEQKYAKIFRHDVQSPCCYVGRRKTLRDLLRNYTQAKNDQIHVLPLLSV